MSNHKQNNMVVRGMVVLVSVLAGLGIWTVVNKPVQSSALSSNSAVVLPSQVTNPNFNYTDTFLTQPVQPSVQSNTSRTPRFRTRGS